MDSRVWQATVRGVAKVGHDLTTKERERDFNDWGFPGGSVCKESACDEGDHLQCRRPGFISWVGKIPWRRKWPPTPVFLPGKSHGQRRLAGYSPWGCKGLDMIEQLKHTQMPMHMKNKT